VKNGSIITLKTYKKPRLKIHGDAKEITRGGTNTKYSDHLGGTQPFP